MTKELTKEDLIKTMKESAIVPSMVLVRNLLVRLRHWAKERDLKVKGVKVQYRDKKPVHVSVDLVDRYGEPIFDYGSFGFDLEGNMVVRG